MVPSVTVIVLLAALLCAGPTNAKETVTNDGPVWVNELSLSNRLSGRMGFEVAALAGEDISAYTVTIYFTARIPRRGWRPRGRGRGRGHGRGRGRRPPVYVSVSGSRTVPLSRKSSASSGPTFNFYRAFIPYRLVGPIGVALVDGSGALVEFLSVGGVLTPITGSASGFTSTDIGVQQKPSTFGLSLQRIGTGDKASDFTWDATQKPRTYDAINNGQTIVDGPEAHINEIHYENFEADAGEGIEVRARAGTNLGGWTLTLYNGNDNTVYDTIALSGVVPDDGDGIGFLSFSRAPIQNGPSDGIALVDSAGNVVEFLCYEGTITASGGPANGQTCVDIGLSENGNTVIGSSLQITGCGSEARWFVATSSFGSLNPGQSFASPCPASAPATTATRINEIHYENEGTDVNEAIEVRSNIGTDLTGWTIVLYNGNSGNSYRTSPVDGAPMDGGNGVQYNVVSYSSNQIQNGDPDGVALVNANGSVVEFLCYEGMFTASNGAAMGMTCTDIGIKESESTATGDSLQIAGCGAAETWVAGASSFGSVNAAQTYGC